LGDNVFDCTVSNGLDCLITNSAIDLKSDVTWSSISEGTTSCPAGYNANCTVYSFTTTAVLTGTSTTVMTLTQYLANQKVLINPTVNGHVVGPDYAKVDFTVTYPYAAKSQTTNQNIASIALALYAGGTAGSATFQAKFQNNQALVFSGTDDKSAVFSWDGTAQLDGTGATVVVVAISGETIIDYNCPVSNLLCPPIIAGWKVAAAAVKLLGWSSEIMFLSTPGTDVTTWEYDPTYGVIANTDLQQNNGGSFLAPHVYVTLISFFILYFFRR